jgi:hypothetical protein
VGFSHLHAAKPSFPSIPERIADAISEPKALLTELPEVSTAILRPSSSRLYLKSESEDEIQGSRVHRRIPLGKKEQSPRKKRGFDESE